MTSPESGGREAQYPIPSIKSTSQRDAIKSGLAQPLVDRNAVGLAFRILWRSNQEMVWRKILAHRVACDKFIKTMEGITMMVSAITGMVGKSTQSADGKIVNPGISYWIVLESANIDPRAIIRSVQGALQGQAEVKLLQEPPIMSAIDTMQTTLCTVMKDHSNTYIKRRMAESEVNTSDPVLPGQGYTVRLVVQQNYLVDLANKAKDSMSTAGVYVDVMQY